MQPIQEADPRARRVAFGLVGVAAIAGLGAILAIEHFREDLKAALERNIDYFVDNPAVLALGALVLLSPVLAAAIYLLIFGKRTVRSERYPPSGYALVRDTVVVSGKRAIRRGHVIQLLSWFLMCAAMAVPTLVYYIVSSLGKAA